MFKITRSDRNLEWKQLNFIMLLKDDNFTFLCDMFQHQVYNDFYCLDRPF